MAVLQRSSAKTHSGTHSERGVSRSGRPRHDEAEKLGPRILAVALEQCFRRGLNGATMDGVAAAVPVSKRTLYQRYGSKPGLLRAVREWQRDLYRNAADIPLPEGSLRERLSALALLLLRISLTPHSIGLERLMVEIDRREPGFADEVRMEVISHWTGRFRATLATEPALGNDPEMLDFLAACLFDALVAGPRARILTWRDLADTEQARKAHVEKILDLAGNGVPALRRTDSGVPALHRAGRAPGLPTSSMERTS